MVRSHRPGEAAFKSILPEDIKWNPSQKSSHLRRSNGMQRCRSRIFLPNDVSVDDVACIFTKFKVTKRRGHRLLFHGSVAGRGR